MPGASVIGRYFRLPIRGGFRIAPARAAIHSAQSSHQVLGWVVAAASQSAVSAGNGWSLSITR